MVIYFHEFVTMMSNLQLSDAKCNRNNQNLKQTKTFRNFQVFNFVHRAKSKTGKPQKFSYFSC